MISLLLAALMALQADDFPFGPLDQRAHGLFQLSTTGFVPDAPTNLKEDELQIHMSLSSINVLNFSDKSRYMIDMEFERISLNMWYGVTDRFHVGTHIPFETVTGGIEDAFIAEFHKTFGLSLGSRDKTRRNRVGVIIDGQPIDIQPTSGMSDIMLYADYQILKPGEFPGWSVGLQVKLPTANPRWLYDDHGLGVGLATNVFYQVNDWYFNVGVSVATPGHEIIFGQKARPFVETLFMTVEYRVLDWMSIVGQGILQSGSTRSFDEYSKWSLEIDGGFKFIIGDRVTWDLGFFENAVKYENSADFGLFTGLTVKY